MGEDSFFPKVTLDIGFLRELAVAQRTETDTRLLEAAASDDQTSVLSATEIPEEQWPSAVQYLYRRRFFSVLNLKRPLAQPLDKGFSEFFYRLPAGDVSKNNTRVFVEAAVSFSNRDPQCPKGLCLPNFFRVLSDDIRFMMIQHWFSMLESEKAPNLEMRLNSVTWLTAVANENYFTDQILEVFVKRVDRKLSIRRTIELAVKDIYGIKDRPDLVLKFLKDVYPNNQREGSVREAIVLVLKTSDETKGWPDLVLKLNGFSPKSEWEVSVREIIVSALKDSDGMKNWPDLVLKLVKNLAPDDKKEEKVRAAIALALKDIDGMKGRPDLALQLVKSLSPENEMEEDVREAVVSFFGAVIQEMAVDRLAPIWANWGKMEEPKLVTLIQDRLDRDPSEKVRKKAAEVLEASRGLKGKS